MHDHAFALTRSSEVPETKLELSQSLVSSPKVPRHNMLEIRGNKRLGKYENRVFTFRLKYLGGTPYL